MTAAIADPADFIRAHLPVMTVPGIPEIRLHKAVPGSGLARLVEADGHGSRAPYWAHHWAGGLALARHILDHPNIVAGKDVLDLGTGGGLVAIAAAKAGANRVIAADIDALAIAALPLNAALNDVALDIVEGDLTTGASPCAEVVLVGDLFYDARLAARVEAFLDRCLNIGMTVLVGDPRRADLPTHRLCEIASYRVIETGIVARPAAVFRFCA